MSKRKEEYELAILSQDEEDNEPVEVEIKKIKEYLNGVCDLNQKQLSDELVDAVIARITPMENGAFGGLDTPTKGSVTLAGKDLYRMKEDALAVFRRRKIGFVFQAFNLVSSVNVWENIVLPLGLDGRKVDEAYVNDIIATLGIENRIYNLPNQLSGGQQQRVAIARALVNRPEIIFADEPTGNLDSKTSDEVIALLKMSAKKYGQTIVMITHDDEIAQVADRILVIEDGQVVDFR